MCKHISMCVILPVYGFQSPKQETIMINPINHDVINEVTRESRLKLMLDTSFSNSKKRETILFTIMQNDGDDFIRMVWNRTTEYIKTRLSTLNPQLKDQENP